MLTSQSGLSTCSVSSSYICWKGHCPAQMFCHSCASWSAVVGTASAPLAVAAAAPPFSSLTFLLLQGAAESPFPESCFKRALALRLRWFCSLVLSPGKKTKQLWQHDESVCRTNQMRPHVAC